MPLPKKINPNKHPEDAKVAKQLSQEWCVPVESISYGDAHWRILQIECERSLADGKVAEYRNTRVSMVRHLLAEGKADAAKPLALEAIYLAYAGPDWTDEIAPELQGVLPKMRRQTHGPEIHLYMQIFEQLRDLEASIVSETLVQPWLERYPMPIGEVLSEFKIDWEGHKSSLKAWEVRQKK